MRRLSTQCLEDIEKSVSWFYQEQPIKPRRQTIEFLSQFARVYHVEPSMSVELNGLILN